MNRIKYLILFLGFILINGILHCSLNEMAGGGTEDGNPTVVSGIILTSNGTPAVNTQVKLISSTYDPIHDSAIPGSQIGTTNADGLYLLKTTTPGTYNILALDPIQKTRLMIKDIVVASDTVTVMTDTLKQPGSVYIRLPDSTNEIGGHLYIEGTDIYARVDSTALQSGFILIDSVPAGEIPNIVYTDTDESVPLTDSVTVISGTTIHISELRSICYSVGTYVGDLKTGTPLITLSSGTALFSQPQPDNIGVGDVIAYGPDNKRVFISGRVGNTQYTVQTAKGIIPSDVSNVTVHSIKRAFNCLDDALDAVDGGTCACDSMHLNTTDLVTANYKLNIACYADGTDSTRAIVKGWTTGAKNYIRMYTPVLGTEVGTSQRHPGKWDDNAYQLAVTATAHYQSCIAVVVPHVRIEGLQLFISPQNFYSDAIEYYRQVNGELYVSNCIIKANTTSNYNSVKGITVSHNVPSGSIIKIWNNIIYDFHCPDTLGQFGIFINATGCTGIVCNNTSYNCRTGIAGWLTDFSVINNIVIGAENGFFNWDSAGVNIDYNISDILGDFPGANSINGATVSFTDSAARDFHLAVNDTTARDNGMADPAAGLYTDDIDGQERIGVWDIGADEGF